jgi:hypothetical protein
MTLLREGEAFIINWPGDGMTTEEGVITPDQAAVNFSSQERSAYKDVRVLPVAIDEIAYGRGRTEVKGDVNEVAIVGTFSHIK